VAVDGAACDPPNTVDQRGAARANDLNGGGAACDIGAYEISDQSPTAVFLQGATAAPVTQSGLIATLLAGLSAVTLGFWRPSFVTALAPQDRCHLNGFAMLNGEPKFVTALGETDAPGFNYYLA
jgi:hypothetical protein